MLLRAPILVFTSVAVFGQAQPAQQPMPVYEVTKVERTARAVTFTRGQASTLDLRGTQLAPASKGSARVDARSGSIVLDINVQKLQAATQYGREYLTYVVWAITPEGRSESLGEIQLNGDKGSLRASTGLQAFGLIVTAEPYFAVSQPSDVVVMEGVQGKGTRGVIQPIDAKYELMGRGEYVKMAPPEKYPPIHMDPRGVLQVYEAINAVTIAKSIGAETYAPESLKRAETELQNANGFLAGGKDKKRAETAARAAVQQAEDARLLTLRKREEERQARIQAGAEAAKQRAEEEALRAKESDARRREAEANRKASELAAAQAAADAEKAQALRAQAEVARAEALQAQQQAEAARKEAEAARLKAEADRTAIRNQLRDQLNRVLATRESARGLIVDVGDVNFDFGKFTLRPEARERLARVTGILIATPGLKVAVEGHTDSIGSDEFNQKLSEQRAETVRSYLTDSGFPRELTTSVGFGKTKPIADNSTNDGRQSNRRVELVVSGERIGQTTDEAQP